MIHCQKLRVSSVVIKCLSYFSGLTHIYQGTRFYRTKQNAQIPGKTLLAIRQEAQSALTEYLHTTRSLPFTDAEHISKNSPHFLETLLNRVNLENDVARSVVRFLRYNPINEFEPFFESLGLSPSEFLRFLPPNIMFLNDDTSLMENYHALCNYGVQRNKIGIIYKKVPEVFQYAPGFLKSKLRSFEEFGLNQTTVAKFVCLSPHLLKENVHRDFFMVLDKLKSVGIESGVEYEWIKGKLSIAESYNWRRVCEVMFLFNNLGFSEEQLRNLVCQNPELLFDTSGHGTFSLIGLMLKFGSARDDLKNMFLNLPNIKVGKFLRNLRNSYVFLVGIDMINHDIGNMFRAHNVLLGSCSLKKVVTLLSSLKTGKKKICKMILADPNILKEWVFGLKVGPLTSTEEAEEDLKSKAMKTNFLLSLGFVENSSEMEKALKAFRGKGLELQERYDCLVNAGLNPNDVAKMVKVSPHILNQSKEHIEAKIEFFKSTLGIPVSCLVSFPNYISYTCERSTLRLSMYKWLKDQGRVRRKLALSTLIASSEKIFMKTYVNPHPGGPCMWEKLKREVYPN
ncbi:unnamed protein product [Cuscuta epithymum]|uniref:Transcription termination factor MTEF18, mitochondrial-like n=1 Tax=Cuscuta epithymum TaxID=186058 RepID=A0AAV0CK89_9ASTE|nr:unnamed protein product [Cuscuta epithymum]